MEPSQQTQDDSDVRRTLSELMPWVATVLLHGAAVLIAILVVWATLDRTVVEQPVVPYVGVINDQPQALSLKPDRVPVQKPGGTRSVEKHVNPVKETRKSTSAIAPPVIGPAGQDASVQGKFLPSTAGTDGIFDPGGRVRGSARSFVFVIDASGSMIDTLPFVMAELKRTIRSMGEKHTFTVLFYQDEKVFESLSSGLKPATEETKQRVFDWMDSDAMAPAGLSNPILAIEQGLKYKPEVMFLLSDNITGQGRYELNQQILLSRIKRANVAGTKINTIQFLYPDPLSRIPGMKPTMQLISEQSGGLYRFVTGKELGL